MQKRIWELDALRGVCIVGMVVVHLVFDLIYLYNVLTLGAVGDGLFMFLTQWGGVLFILLSGICVTLGSHPVRRGLVVFGCGLLCTLVTYAMYYLRLQDKSIIIYFGILHCLGACMLLWPLLKRLPVWALGFAGIAVIALGFWLETVHIDGPWLVPVGVLYPGFISADYFPLFPNLGYFLLGAVLGKTVYKRKQSLLPKWNENFFLIGFFRACGKYSLFIYLLHQPVLAVVLELIL